MVKNLTQKGLDTVFLSPLDGSARNFVLYGLREESLNFNVSSPTKRTVTNSAIVQNRGVSLRKFTVQVLIFEPVVSDDDARYRPNASSIYQFEADTVSRRLTAREQLDILYTLAKLHENGVMLSYRGIAIDVDQCQIVNVDASTVYVNGAVTITLEERPSTVVDISDVAIDFDRIAHELAKIEPVGVSPTEAQDRIQADDLTTQDYVDIVKAQLLASALPDVRGAFDSNNTISGGVQTATDDPSTLQKYGLRCLPLITSKLPTETHQIFPTTTTETTPLVKVVPLQPTVDKAVSNLGILQGHAAGGVGSTASRNFSIVVPAQGLLIRFVFTPSYLSGAWTVRAEVFDGGEPPRGDYRTTNQVKVNADDDCPETPALVAPQPKVEGDGTPLYVTEAAVHFGEEVALTSTLKFAFVGEGGKNPWGGRTKSVFLGIGKKPDNDPHGVELRDLAIVLADYR